MVEKIYVKNFGPIIDVDRNKRHQYFYWDDFKRKEYYCY